MSFSFHFNIIIKNPIGNQPTIHTYSMRCSRHRKYYLCPYSTLLSFFCEKLNRHTNRRIDRCTWHRGRCFCKSYLLHRGSDGREQTNEQRNSKAAICPGCVPVNSVSGILPHSMPLRDSSNVWRHFFLLAKDPPFSHVKKWQNNRMRGEVGRAVEWEESSDLLQNHSATCCLQGCFDFLSLVFGNISTNFLGQRLHEFLSLFWERQTKKTI